MSKEKFKPFQRVLVRDHKDTEWVPREFSNYMDSNFPYVCTDSCRWRYCIPYEGNEKLSYTTHAPKQEQEFVFGQKVVVWDNEGEKCKARFINYNINRDKNNRYCVLIKDSTAPSFWRHCMAYEWDE